MTTDALLLALADARHRKEQAEQMIRLLVAWGRELATPRPYRLADLAEAAGISISGVRTAYQPSDVERAALLFPPPGSPQFQDYWQSVTACRDKYRPGKSA
jgi:hypothetical protein